MTLEAPVLRDAVRPCGTWQLQMSCRKALWQSVAPAFEKAELLEGCVNQYRFTALQS